MGFFDKLFKKQTVQVKVAPKSKQEIKLENIKRIENMDNTRAWNEGEKYHFSDEARDNYYKIKQLKEEYLEENPQDYEIIGADLMQTFWFATDTATPEDKQIYKVVGKARYHELNNNYKEALRLYEIGNNLFFKAHGAELKEIEREAGKKLAPQVTEQRIEVCKTRIFREKTKEMEKEAKSLEETDPEAAIRLYEELNRLRPGLKKYDKRIKVCKNKLG